jgi:hypothetical protein
MPVPVPDSLPNTRDPNGERARARGKSTEIYSRPMKRLVAVLIACLSTACSRPVPEQKVAPPQAARAQLLPAAGRLVAIGDLHGDLDATRRALRLAGALGPDEHWAGGALTVVQTGDTIDRGDQDREVIDLLERLRGEAKHAGGALIVLSGNHEVMNVASDFRYVSQTSAAAFEMGRTAAFAPGGPYARRLAEWPVIQQVGDSVFVHAGVLPHHVRYGIDKLNRETSAWMRGAGPLPALLMQEDAPIWTRVYSTPGMQSACVELAQALNALSAKRMVVGHTPQPSGINAACDGRVWRIDTGLSAFYGGALQVLEVLDGQVRVLSEPR